MGFSLKRVFRKIEKQVKRSAGDIAAVAVNPVAGVQAIAAREAADAVLPDIPQPPADAEIEALEEAATAEAETAADARKRDLARRRRESGRPSTIKTSPLGLAGLGGRGTALAALLGRRNVA